MAAIRINETAAAGKMTHFCRKITRGGKIRWSLVGRISILFRIFWDRIISCSSIGKQQQQQQHHVVFRYRRLSSQLSSKSAMEAAASEAIVMESSSSRRIYQEPPTSSSSSSCIHYDSDSDLVNLKISLLGDCQIGKTTFVIKYVGDEQEKKSLQMKGLNLMDKTLIVRDARIAFKIWDVGGDPRSFDQVPIACKDAVAILFMFDLTNRTTLNSVIGWYREARKWNQTAIPILIGTKFDDFVQLPIDIQWSVITQARSYARAMRATLFFSSATHNINVNKIFKFIMAKLFNLPWNVERNLTIGEPIIDFF